MVGGNSWWACAGQVTQNSLPSESSSTIHREPRSLRASAAVAPAAVPGTRGHIEMYPVLRALALRHLEKQQPGADSVGVDDRGNVGPALLGDARCPAADNPYWIVRTGEGPGIDGGLVLRQGPEPAADNPVSAFVITVDVEDLDKTVAAVEQSGGTVALPRQPVPGVGWLAYLKDTEGNIFGAMQSDEAAR